MMSQSGKQTIAIHILPKFSQLIVSLIEYNMGNIFLEKS